MSPGKMAAQVGHAVLGAWIEAESMEDMSEVLETYLVCGMPKIVLKVKDETQMLALESKARQEGIHTHMVKDAGKTEVDPGTLTVCAIGPWIKEEIDQITGDLDLYK